MKLILIRGLPGSGKSTVAKMLLQGYVGAHFEADQYFMQDGEYKFDVERLHLAHRWCQDQARLWLEGCTENEVVIVSNTFTTLKELKPYFAIAAKFDITPQVITCHGCWDNVHRVPKETLDKMRDRFVGDISSLYESVGE
jgi:tRNA uridine 5-carbamoylmethylation protein Kti12